MIGADLVETSRKGEELRVRLLSGARRETALGLAEALLGVYQVGLSRSELQDAVASIEPAPRDRRLFLALKKMVEDRSSFESAPAIDPIALRADVFAAATAFRRVQPSFDRTAVIASAALGLSLSNEALEHALFADLRDAERLIEACPLGPKALLAEYDREQIQAVLLRAVKVSVELDAGSPEAARALFRRLKFLQLLYEIERLPDDRWRLTIDGPFSLFESVTKYGLKLALIVPLLEATRSYRLTAEVRWGKTRAPLIFRCEGGVEAELSPLSDEHRELLERMRALAPSWNIVVATELLDLPGAGICVPDLQITTDRGAIVFVEFLGHWSRSAVWKRVELVEKGLSAPIIFAISERLRVSEEVLPPEAPSALYVYKGKISAQTLLDKAAALTRATSRSR